MTTPYFDSLFHTNDSVNNFLFTPILSSDTARVKSDTFSVVKVESIIPTGFIGKPLPITPSGEAWVSFLFLLLFLLFAYVISRGRKMMEQTIKDFFYLKERASIFSDSTVRELRHKIYLISISVVSIAFFSYHLLYNLNEAPFSLQKITLLVAAIAGFFLVKYILFYLLGNIFFNKSITQVWIRSYFTLLFAIGLGLFPISILLIYSVFFASKLVVWVGIMWVLTSFVMLVYKSIQIFLNRSYSIFYLMLYLCTLEILPILLLGKALLKA